MAANAMMKVGKIPNPLNISTLFFDLDNTLIPTRKGDSKACRKLGEQLESAYKFVPGEASQVTAKFLQSFRRCPDNPQTSLDSWRSYLWRDALPERFKHLAEQIYAQWLHLRYRYLAIPPDYVQMLKQFRSSGYLLALITNGPSNAQWEKVKKLNVSQYFDCVLVSSDLPWEKPNPNIFLAACNYLHVKPAECVMIGDKIETDVQGGKAANLGATIWVPLNPNVFEDLDAEFKDNEHMRPDLILQNLCDMKQYFPKCKSEMGSSNGGSSSKFPHADCSSSSHTMRRINSQVGVSSTRKYQAYRRGVSLPDIDCSSENSCDSIFS
ncbi:N-acylneuraminate-9-phosphatase [Eupeodes corollae]|uniref:N-acylneuraminate-9-phosphatase n=1 Tax=Eupeodes corollae TaxID=290404 RepID=UPI00249382B5|nr:N-acylneuraminate-9-phosphatase [Eupeodes corollae]